MSDTNSPPRSPPPTERRRSSFAGQAFADLFGRQPNGPSPNSNGNSNANYQGPITSAAAQANRRRLSLTTLGLSGSPNQPSPFNTMRSRGESVSSATSGSFNESPFDDDDTSSSNSPPNTAATSPFARRLSFGARALRDVKQGNGSGNTSANGRARPNASSKSPTPSTNITATKGRGLSCSLPSIPSALPLPNVTCTVPFPAGFGISSLLAAAFRSLVIAFRCEQRFPVD